MIHSNDESQIAMPATEREMRDDSPSPTNLCKGPQIAMPARSWLGVLSVFVRAVIPIGLLAIGGIAYSIFSVEPEKEKSPPAEPQALRTRVVELKVQDYPVVIRTNGLVQAHNEVALSAQVSGQITRISDKFEVGSYFSEGDILVELDSRDYKTAIAVAEAQRLGAESALQLAAQDHERKLRLLSKDGVSEVEVNQAAANRAQAAAQLDAAVAQLDQARRDLERTTIRAPFDGRVRQQDTGLGQLVGTGTPLGIVFAVDFAEVRLPIAGPDLKYLELPELTDDAPVDVELRDAISDSSEHVWKAQIIRTEGVVDENSLELFAIARIDDPFGRKSGEPPLRIGQPVTGSIAGKSLIDVIALPRIAVRQLDQIFLVEKKDQTLVPLTIEPILSDSEHVIVRNPLITDGAWLSTTRIVFAPEGATVEIIPEPEVELTATTSAADANAEPVKN